MFREQLALLCAQVAAFRKDLNNLDDLTESLQQKTETLSARIENARKETLALAEESRALAAATAASACRLADISRRVDRLEGKS